MRKRNEEDYPTIWPKEIGVSFLRLADQGYKPPKIYLLLVEEFRGDEDLFRRLPSKNAVTGAHYRLATRRGRVLPSTTRKTPAGGERVPGSLPNRKEVKPSVLRKARVSEIKKTPAPEVSPISPSTISLKPSNPVVLRGGRLSLTEIEGRKAAERRHKEKMRAAEQAISGSRPYHDD